MRLPFDYRYRGQVRQGEAGYEKQRRRILDAWHENDVCK
jgi:hypothetical protein